MRLVEDLLFVPFPWLCSKLLLEQGRGRETNGKLLFTKSTVHRPSSLCVSSLGKEKVCSFPTRKANRKKMELHIDWLLWLCVLHLNHLDWGVAFQILDYLHIHNEMPCWRHLSLNTNPSVPHTLRVLGQKGTLCAVFNISLLWPPIWFVALCQCSKSLRFWCIWGF